MNIQRSLPVLLAWFGIAFAAHGQKTYDPSADFSATQNPHGVWTFGWSAEIAGLLHIYKHSFETASSHNWSDETILSLGAPCMAYNWHNATIDNIPGRSMYMHPGPQNQFSHCIFTATASALYDIHASFTAISTGAPRVYILHNRRSISSSRLKQGKPWKFSLNSVDLEPGDTLDVVVGVGTNNVFFSDGTAFSLTISRVFPGNLDSANIRPGVGEKPGFYGTASRRCAPPG